MLRYLLLLCCGTLFAQDVYVNGYYRSNGTYVEGHYRTAPNNTINDNYSTVGNVNPYTGEPGTVPRETEYYYDVPNTYVLPSNNNIPNGSYNSTTSYDQIFESFNYKNDRVDNLNQKLLNSIDKELEDYNYREIDYESEQYNYTDVDNYSETDSYSTDEDYLLNKRFAPTYNSNYYQTTNSNTEIIRDNNNKPYSKGDHPSTPFILIGLCILYILYKIFK